VCTNYRRSLNFWTTSFYYLKLVQVVSEQIVNQGNQYIVIGDYPISPEEYEEQIKWSDHNIALPLLYNFYHGLELLLKGFVLLKHQSQNPNLNHKIEQLLENFKLLYSNEVVLIRILEKYISSTPMIEPLKSFFNSNNISPNMFYQALRYPYNQTLNKEFRHIDLKYRGTDGIRFYQEIINDIKKIRELSVSLGRSLEPLSCS
jgi:hypothetical protein